MKKNWVVFFVTVFCIVGILVATTYEKINDTAYIDVTAENKISINNDDNFNKIMEVLMSPRCINCHPSDHIPKQGDDRHPHYFGMTRGKDNIGYDGTKCTTCHQNQNNEYSGVPGAPHWSLAPATMAWEGLSSKEIAASILDPKRNGDKNHEALMHHLTGDALVLWAWNPGIRADGTAREKPPVPLEEFKEAVKKWIEEGAVIPE